MYIVCSEFHDNLNYVITWKANGSPATQSGDKFATITEEKDLKDDSTNFTIAMSLVIHNFVYGLDFTFPI